MTDDQILEFATEFRAGLLNGSESCGACYMVCAPLSRLLELHGVDAQIAELEYPEDAPYGVFNHTWITLGDGRVLDPTADQFNADGFDLPPVYLGPPLAIHGDQP